MPEGRLTTSLQESVLTLICMDDEKGKVAANIVDLELFEPPYDDIASKAIQFRKKHKQAPGEAHLDDLFDHILSNPKNKKHRLYEQVLGNIVEQAKGIKADYVLSRLEDFMDEQNLKASILEAAERMERGGEGAREDSKGILNKALKFRPDSVTKGIYLSDKKSITYLTQYNSCDYHLGINEFDKRGIGLTRGEAMGFMAPAKRGKTWFCIHEGIMVLIQGGKVLHISLEMGEERIMPRYLRRLLAIAKRREKYRKTTFDLDEMNRVIGFKQKFSHPQLSLDDPDIETKVAKKMTTLGTRLNRLHFKSFPTSKLTMGALESYIDTLEATDGFVPDVLMLDYPKLMKLDRKQELRIGLGLRMEELRGLCVERKLAGLFPIQSNRESETATLVSAKHTGEDYSLVQTMDNVITYSQTRAERRMGMARLYANMVRADQSDFVVLITQDYETGQFVRQSAYMPNETEYWRMIKQEEEDEEDGD